MILVNTLFLKTLKGRDLSVKANGSLTYAYAEKDGNASGTVVLVSTKGVYPLSKPFLGMNRVEFDIVEIKAKSLSGVLQLEQFAVSGPQIMFLQVEVNLAGFFKKAGKI